MERPSSYAQLGSPRQPAAVRPSPPACWLFDSFFFRAKRTGKKRGLATAVNTSVSTSQRLKLMGTGLLRSKPVILARWYVCERSKTPSLVVRVVGLPSGKRRKLRPSSRPWKGRQCRQATTGALEEPLAGKPGDRRQQPPRLLGTAARARVAHNRQSKPASPCSVSAALRPRQKRPRACAADPPVQAWLIVCLKRSVCVCVCARARSRVTCPVAQGPHNHVLTRAGRAVMHLAAASGTKGMPRRQPRQDTMDLSGNV